MTESKLIFDIGMHIGQDTRHYLQEGYKVIAVEANPMLAEKNAVRFRNDIEKGRLIIENVGISDRRSVLPFYINRQVSEWSSFDITLGSRRGDYETVQITCVTINDLIEKYGLPYYIKVDIEGYDCYVINALPDHAVPYVSCEFTDVQLIDALYDKGYRKFKLISQGDGFKPINLKKERSRLFQQYLHYKNGLLLRLQRFIRFKFPYSSSGPFGENTKGAWVDFDTARNAYVTFTTGNNGKIINEVDWFDLHAANN